MRIRFFVWVIFCVSCLSVLLFASLVRREVPAIMQVHLDQPHPLAYQLVTLMVHLTDQEGLPIEQAHVLSSSNMTTMDMGEQVSQWKPAGQGNYLTHLQLSMAGPWAITLMVHVDGFTPLHQMLFVEVMTPSSRATTNS
jgi:hypothetical protein